jgi:hypothetical protein
VRREIPSDLKADSFVSPGDQGDGFILPIVHLHSTLPSELAPSINAARAVGQAGSSG